MKKLIILLFFLQALTLYAQEETLNVNDTIVWEFPCLICDYYNEVHIADRNYEYELISKKQKLNMWSNVISISGDVLFGLVIFVNSVLAVNNNWNLWIDLPCATLVSMSVMGGCIIWSNNLKRRADAIEIAPIVGLYSGNTLGLNMTIRF